jgi:hypothetical protein
MKKLENILIYNNPLQKGITSGILVVLYPEVLFC